MHRVGGGPTRQPSWDGIAIRAAMDVVAGGDRCTACSCRRAASAIVHRTVPSVLRKRLGTSGTGQRSRSARTHLEVWIGRAAASASDAGAQSLVSLWSHESQLAGRAVVGVAGISGLAAQFAC